ncbi:MAG: helix-turn-helix transcriptional regulator [Acutalibacteraceae bacterium]|nr:helix-turn-helix transcriptional regulator [Acutalibacteraceae bacterium]
MKNLEIILSKPENILRTFNYEGSVFSMKQRPSSVIIIALCGKIDFVFEDKTLPCNGSNAIFIPKGATYQVVCHEYSESLLFNFQTTVEPKSPEPLGEPDRKSVEELFQKTALLFAHTEHSRYMLFSAYYELFSLIFDTEYSNKASEKYVVTAENIMIQKFASNSLTCADISKECNISQVYLRKLFIKYRNITPYQFLLNLRMKKAKIYLNEGYSVSEVAQTVGYSDVYQFSRAYKKHFGYPPSAKSNN